MKCFKCDEEVSMVKTINSYKVKMDDGMTVSNTSGSGYDVCYDCYEEMEKSDKYILE